MRNVNRILHHEIGRLKQAGEVLDDEEDHRDEQGRQDVERLDLLDFQQGKPGGGDQKNTDDCDLGDQRAGEEIGREVLGDQVDPTLPTEEDRGNQEHSPAETGPEDHCGDEVEGRVGEEHRRIVADRRHDGADDREGADAAEQDPGGQALDQLGLATEMLNQAGKALVKVQPGADQGPDGEADDEEDGVVTLGHIIDDVFQPNSQGGQAHHGEEGLLVFFTDAALEQAADAGAEQDRAGVGVGSDHECFPPKFNVPLILADFVMLRSPSRHFRRTIAGAAG